MGRSAGARWTYRAVLAPCAVLIAGSTLAAGLLAPSAAADSFSPRLAAVGGLAHLPANAQVTGALSAGRVIDLGLALRLRDAAGLRRYASLVAQPRSALFHHYLTPTEVAARFGPSPSERRAVERDLRQAGLAVLNGGGLLVRIRGRVGSIEDALHTHLVRIRLASGRLGWDATSAPKLSAAIAGDVSAVLGLDNLLSPHAQPLTGTPPARVVPQSSPRGATPSTTPQPCSAAASESSSEGGWTFDDLANAYGLGGLWSTGGLGAGESIDVFELEPFLRSNVATFDRCYFGASHVSEITSIPVDGFAIAGAGPSGEATLDVEVLSALAPAAHLYVYDAPNTAYGAIDEYDAMVTQDHANLISTSWGECETALDASAPGTTQVENEIFEQAVAQGQTVFASAGDTGADDCAGTQFSSSSPEPPYLSVDDPASQPEVVAVGGTSLHTDHPPLGGTAETVWNDGPHGGGAGGGYSSIWSEPAWQADSGVEGVPTSGKRAVPDVSIEADPDHGVGIYQSGWSTIGGTSLAAPTWTAIAADVATSASCAALPVDKGGVELGFVAPELYEVAAVDYSSAFNDITLGSNDVFGRGLGYAAAPGFDLASGLGTPIVTSPTGPALASDWCDAALGSLAGAPAADSVTGLAPTSGPIAGGTTLTISGSFGATNAADVHVVVGANPASIVAVTPSAISVVTPPATVLPVSKVASGAGPQVVEVSIHAGSGLVSSSPSAAAVFHYVATRATSTVPTVNDVGPGGGPSAGGNVVAVLGSGFGPRVPRVTFGGVASSAVRIVNSDQLSVRVPAKRTATHCVTGPHFVPATDCQVQVIVHQGLRSSRRARIFPARSGALAFDADGVIVATPGTEVMSAPTEYDYAPVPKITSITPDPVSGHGGSAVTILGSGFDLNTLDWVNFGPSRSESSEVTTLSYLSPTRITVDSPVEGHAASARATSLAGGVTVQSLGGLSNAAPFRYLGGPTLRRGPGAVVPGRIGQVVHLSGTALEAVDTVEVLRAGAIPTFVADASVRVRNRSSLSVELPALPTGRYELRACRATRCSGAVALNVHIGGH